MKTTKGEYKDGVTVKPSCELPHVQLIRIVAQATAPDTEDGICWTTEAWREPRHTDDAHNWCSAFDLRIRNILSRGPTDREMIAAEWVRRMRDTLLDGRYQFELESDHIHAEFDPR